MVATTPSAASASRSVRSGAAAGAPRNAASVAQPTPIRPLPRLAGEPGDDDLDLVAFGTAQEGCDRVALGEAARGLGGAHGGVDEGSEQEGHRLILGCRRSMRA